jgi:excisionase family DNA binding protein
MTKLDMLLEPTTPTKADSELALAASRRLAAFVVSASATAKDKADPQTTVPLRLTLQITPSQQEVGAALTGDSLAGDISPGVALPSAALPLLARLLAEMGQGHAVALLPLETELSTQQAAALLNVSRPFLVGLLDQRQLPSRKVGKHRRVLLRDVLDYKRRDEARRHAILDELTAEAQELGLGY